MDEYSKIICSIPLLSQPRPLSSIKEGITNIVGVITDIVEPLQTSGSDYIFQFYVCDNSLNEGEKGLQIIIFTPDISILPPIKFIGDIIFFKDIRIKSYESYSDQKKYQGLMLERKIKSVLGIYSGNISSPIIPRDINNTKLLQLQESSTPKDLISYYKKKAYDIISNVIENDGYVSKIENLHITNNNIDLYGRVEEIDHPTPNVYVFWLWDGTRITETEDTKYNNIYDTYFVKVRYTMPTNVIHTSKNCTKVIPGLYIKLRGFFVTFDKNNHLILVNQNKSSIGLLANYLQGPRSIIENVKYPREENESRIFNKTSYYAIKYNLQEVLTKKPTIKTIIISKCLSLLNVPTTPIKKILDSTNVPTTYHCMVKVLSHKPRNLKRITQPLCRSCSLLEKHGSTICKTCNKPLVYIYIFTLIIQDSSGTMEVILFDKNADKFFTKIPPVNLEDDSNVFKQIERNMILLLKKSSVLECNIIAYKPVNCDSIRYQIEDTLLL